MSMSKTPKNGIETRVVLLDSSGLGVREAKDGSRRIVGYAARFNQMSEDLGGFRERIRPGAFADSLARGDDVVALVNHDSAKPLGRRSKGTLRLEENTKGLKASIKPPNTTFANDVVENIERGDILGMSFQFRTIEDAWHVEDGGEVRELVKADLIDVSPVTFPAYPSTDVAMRSREAWHQEQAQTPTDVLRRRLDLAETT